MDGEDRIDDILGRQYRGEHTTPQENAELLHLIHDLRTQLAEFASLRGELATIFGTFRLRKGVTKNASILAQIGDYLSKQDEQLAEARAELELRCAVGALDEHDPPSCERCLGGMYDYRRDGVWYHEDGERCMEPRPSKSIRMQRDELKAELERVNRAATHKGSCAVAYKARIDKALGLLEAWISNHEGHQWREDGTFGPGNRAVELRAIRATLTGKEKP